MIQLPSPLVIELPLKGRIVIIKKMKKNKGNRACFCCCPPPAFLAIFEGGLGRVLKRHVRGRWKKALKFYGIYIEIKQLGHNVITSQHPISEASMGKFNV